MLRQRRELGVALVRSAPPPRPPADPAGTARRAAQLAAALGVLAILAVAVAPPTPGDPVFLAGLFERLGEWWNGLPLWAQLLIPFAVAALLTFAGMGFWPALGLVSTISEFAAHGEGIGTFLRNPGQATRDFLRNLTPGQTIGLLAGLVLERILPGALGGLLGRAGRGTIRRTADAAVDAADDSLPRRADDLPEQVDQPAPPRTRQERLDELADDPDRGGATPATRVEAADALALEEAGLVPGPLKRANGRVTPRESGADFVDGTGQLWDHKLAVSGPGWDPQTYLDKIELVDLRKVRTSC